MIAALKGERAVTIFSGDRELEVVDPRPWIGVLIDAVRLLLCMICAASFTFLVWLLMP